MAWSEQQVKQFVRRAKEEAGHGWSMLGARIQVALISEKALGIICGQACESVRVEDATALREAMLTEAGLQGVV